MGLVEEFGISMEEESAQTIQDVADLINNAAPLLVPISLFLFSKYLLLFAFFQQLLIFCYVFPLKVFKGEN